MRESRWIVAAVAAALPFLLAVGVPSQAGADQYVLEFSCGENNGDSDGVVPGEYATVVNAISTNDRSMRARAQVVLTFPRHAVSDWVGSVFDPGQARSLDCDDLLHGVFSFPGDLPEDGFFQGFLRIQAESALNAVARYTVAGDNGEVSSQVLVANGAMVRMPPPPRRGNEPVKICHVPPGNRRNAHTIEVDASAVAAHLAHGDYRGRCDDRYDYDHADDDDDSDSD